MLMLPAAPQLHVYDVRLKVLVPPRIHKVVRKKLRRHNLGVYKYWKAIGFDPMCVVVEWFTTCFITVSPGDLANCVLDLLLAGCEDALLKVALALVDELQDFALGMGLEEMQVTFKNLARKADVVKVMAKALTMPSYVFFPDTNMLLTMVRNIEVMQPSGKRGEYVYTTRPVAPTDLGELIPRTPHGRGRTLKAGKGSLKKDDEDRQREEEGEGEGEEEGEEEDEEAEDSDNEGPADAPLTERSPSSSSASSEVPSLYHRGLGAAATIMREETLVNEGRVTLYMLNSFYSRVMGHHYRYKGPTNADIGLEHEAEADRGGEKKGTTSSRVGKAKAQRLERKGLRKHYRRLLRKLNANAEEPPTTIVVAAQMALLRASRSNGGLVGTNHSSFEDKWGDKGQRNTLSLPFPRLPSPILQTTGIFRFLDKTEYWKDRPRKHSWAHRLVTTSTSNSLRDHGRGSRKKSEYARRAVETASIPEDFENVTRGEDMAMRALLALENKDRPKDDTYLPRGWRDSRLEANRKGMHAYHSLHDAASTPMDRVVAEEGIGTGGIMGDAGGILDMLNAFNPITSVGRVGEEKPSEQAEVGMEEKVKETKKGKNSLRELRSRSDLPQAESVVIVRPGLAFCLQ